MSSIGSVTSAPPPKAGDTSKSLATDQAADKKARAGATKAAAQLATDQTNKANAAAIKADEQAVKTANAEVKKDDAKVKADGGALPGVNVTA